ncbi:MAG: type II secretion system F family protein [Rhodospirillales bacterium]|jgi:tight adherence protein B|nr:type II secretion system F family protein [Rhodospirillales bacterium]
MSRIVLPGLAAPLSAPIGAALLLLLLAVLALAALALSGVLASRAQQDRRRTDDRLAQVADPLARLRERRSVSIARAGTGDRKTPLRRRLGALIGFDPAKADRYPLRWWVVLAAALALARIGAGLAAGVLGAWSWSAVPVATVALSRFFFGAADGRYRQTLLEQLPDALAMIVRAVRVGIPVTEAIRAVAQEAQAPTAAEFARLYDSVLIGVPLEQGLRALGQRSGLGEYRFFATAIALQAQTGGALTEVLENLADVVRKRVALQSRGRALSSEARTSALVLAVLPLATGGMIAVLDPGYMAVLFTTPTGHTLFGAAALSLAIGVGAMRLIIQKTLA